MDMKNKKLSEYAIINEFNKYKNNIDPTKIASQSPKKYWWVCKKGHEWLASCNLRIGKGRNCPYCANQKVCIDNSLNTLYPDIAKEWDNSKNTITPNDVVAGTSKKFWWVCEKGHEWEASCVKRIYGSGCPFCKGRKVCKDNSLSTLYPDIAKEWDNSKNTITPNDVVAGTSKKFWWVCEKGHKWEASCVKRTKSKRGCPVCNESHHPLVFDFVIYKNNEIFCCIEYQGEQHYNEIKHFKEKKYLIKERDEIKRIWCKENNLILLEISYLDYDNIEKILEYLVY